MSVKNLIVLALVVLGVVFVVKKIAPRLGM